MFYISVASLKLTVSEISVIRMFCDVTENDIETIYHIQIRRQESNRSWEALAEIETNKKPILKSESDKYLFASGFLDKETPNNSFLCLGITSDRLTATDDGKYRCELTYKSKITDSATSVNEEQFVSMSGKFIETYFDTDSL